jgi:hypothetical protein
MPREWPDALDRLNCAADAEGHQRISDMSRRSLLLVAVLAQTLFAFVRGHLMSFPFFSTRHDLGVLINYSVLRGGSLLLFWFLGWVRVPDTNSKK